MKFTDNPTVEDFFAARMADFGPIMTGIGLADAGFDEDTTAAGYNDIGSDEGATVNEV